MNNEFKLSKEQSKAFNVLKVIFAIFVVYNHANIVTTDNFVLEFNIPIWLDIFKYSISGILVGCAVDGFFLMSSILLYRKAFEWKTNIKKKIYSLIIPYFLISIIIVVFCLFFESWSITKPFFRSQYALSEYSLVEWLHAFGIGHHCPLNGPLWFLRNLFVLNILSVLIKKAIDKYPKLYLVAVLLFTIFCNYNFFYLIYPIDLLFWSFGYYIVKYNINIDLFNNKKLITTIVYVLSFGIKLYLTYFVKTPKYVLNLIDIINFSSEMILIYSLVNSNINSKMVLTLDSLHPYSFCIYIFHYLPLRFIMRFAIKYLPVNTTVILIEFFVIPIIVIILIIVFTVFLKKYTPKTLGIITGSRN